MKSMLPVIVTILVSVCMSSCYKCYVCSVDTPDGTIERDVCGRKKDIRQLINTLETDTLGNGPWVCE